MLWLDTGKTKRVCVCVYNCPILVKNDFRKLMFTTLEFFTVGFSLSVLKKFLRVSLYFVAVQLLSGVRLFVTPWTAARQASLFFTVSQSLLKLIESVMPSSHLVLCHPLLLSVFPSISLF